MLYYGYKGPVLTLGRGVREDHVLQALLHDFDHKLRPPIVLADGAAVAAATVVSAEAPVDARGLVAHWIEGGGTVEVGHLVGQKLSNGMEHKAAHPEHVQPLSPLDDAGNLLHLIPLDVDPPEDSKRAQLLLTGPFDLMHWTQHGLVLEEHALGADGTGKMVDVGATHSIAAAGGTGALAQGALGEQASVQGNLHVHQRPALGLIYLCGPQGTVEVHPQVQVQVQQAGRPIRGPIPLLMTEAAAPHVSRHLVRSQGCAELFHELSHFPLILLPHTTLLDSQQQPEPLPAHPLPLLEARGPGIFTFLRRPGSGLGPGRFRGRGQWQRRGDRWLS